MSDRMEKVALAAREHSGRIPRRVRFFSPILKFLLVAGMPMGFNRLVTIRGRKSGLPRTTPLAIIEVGGRRWVWAPWGEVQWVRNLRAAGRATITVRGRNRRSHCDRAGPDGARCVLPRHPRPSRAKHSVRCPVHPHRRRCRSQRSGGSGRGSTGLRTPPSAMKSAAADEASTYAGPQAEQYRTWTVQRVDGWRVARLPLGAPVSSCQASRESVASRSRPVASPPIRSSHNSGDGSASVGCPIRDAR